jgi:hypothetical protein
LEPIIKLITYRQDAGVHVGAVVDDRVVRLDDVAAEFGGAKADMISLIVSGEPGLARAREIVAGAERDSLPRLADVQLLAPVLRPPKIMMGGRNYLAEEADGRDECRDLLACAAQHRHHRQAQRLFTLDAGILIAAVYQAGAPLHAQEPRETDATLGCPWLSGRRELPRHPLRRFDVAP